ncbi:hypothetical protein KUTeg_018854 [Tegillarca granosa]|uniref:15-hydroxyprostaglandin dehydrogenase [NAD(+)] n=1 Tax=Tegillarca granosa TaxID=220873 RepID=A0ABQ9EGS4_TEGGR|nr:hypothetical protein KUTeg_018854 [Tegillarca granosa]
MEIKDKVALITGAAQGLGRAFTESLLAEGAKVCFCDVNTTQGQKTLDELRAQYGDKVMFQKCDVSNHKDMQGIIT